MVLHCDRQADLEGAHPHVDARQHCTDIAAELGHQRLGILDQLQLLGDPAVAHGGVILAQLIMLAARADRRNNRIGRQHPAFHRSVAALDPGDVDEAGRATDQRAAREGQLWHRLPAALVDRPRAIGNAAPAFQNGPDFWVLLPALKFLIWMDIGVLVIERGDEAERNLMIGLMVQETAAPAVGFGKRPALGVNHAAGEMLVGIDVPQFLDTKAIDLRLAIAFQIELVFQPLGQMAARAFGKQGVFGVEFHARLVIALVAAIFGHAHILGRDAFDRAIFVIQHFGGREAGEDFHAQFFGLARQPAAQAAQTAGVIAIIRHERRHRPMRDRHVLRRAQHPVPVIGHRSFGHRAITHPPIGQQLVERLRIDHRAREDMRADFRALFKDTDSQIGIDLFEPDRRAKTRRPAADNDDIIRHRFTFTHGRSCSLTSFINRTVEP